MMKQKIWRMLSLLLVGIMIVGSIPFTSYAEDSIYRASELAAKTNPCMSTYSSIDGGTLTTTANDKAKVVIFYNTGCGYSRYTIGNINSSATDYSKIDIVAIDVMRHDADNVKSFREVYGGNKMKYTYDTTTMANSDMWSYCRQYGISGSIYFPCIAYIGADNKLYGVTTGPKTDAEFKTCVDKYLSEAFTAPGSGSPTPTTPQVSTVPDVTVSYRTHVQSYGWQNYVTNGTMSGTSGESKRLEGINISVSGNQNLGIRYRTHVQTYGWQDWKYDGAMSGTSGESKRLEAIQIELTGADKDKYDVYYRVHAQSYGWLGWAKNGAQAGTAGQSKRLEGIEILVLKKGQTPSDGQVGYSFIGVGKSSTANPNDGLVNYMTHVQSYGDQKYVSDGSVSGTFGEAKRLEGIRINVNNEKLGISGGITYQTHVQTYGWLDWSSNGDFNGTHGESKRLEAIKIKLTGELANKYDVYYRVHSQTFGWLGWAKNGESAGTAGYAKRLEGIQIVLLPKGSAAPSANPGTAGMPGFITR